MRHFSHQTSSPFSAFQYSPTSSEFALRSSAAGCSRKDQFDDAHSLACGGKLWRKQDRSTMQRRFVHWGFMNQYVMGKKLPLMLNTSMTTNPIGMNKKKKKFFFTDVIFALCELHWEWYWCLWCYSTQNACCRIPKLVLWCASSFPACNIIPSPDVWQRNGVSKCQSVNCHQIYLPPLRSRGSECKIPVAIVKLS